MKKVKLIFLLFLPLLIISVMFYVVKNIRISQITCRSQYGECSFLIKERLESIKDCDYSTCKKILDSQLSEMFLVENYTYRLKFPLRMEVDLVERKPKYSISNLKEQVVVQVDAEGLVLYSRDSSNLPGFFIEESLPVTGNKISDIELFALQLVYGVSKIQEIDSAKLQMGLLNVDLKDGKRILFPLEGDRDFLLGSLALILNELKITGTDFGIGDVSIKEIDLRFKNPVLR